MALKKKSNSNKIRILFFINSLRGGGAERVMINLVNHMNHEKYDVTVLTLFNAGINKKFLNTQITYKYVFRKKFLGVKHILKLFSSKRLYQLSVREKYDITISYLQGITTRIIAGGPSTAIKVAWIHGTFYKSFHAKSYRSANEMIRLYRKYDAIVGASNHIINSFRMETGINKRTSIIYNTHDINSIIQKSLSSSDTVFQKKYPNLITAGSFLKVKGYERLLKCVLQLKRNGYKFHLHLLGTGELKERLKNYVSKNNLDEFVSFWGFQSNPYKYFRKADLFVCSSYSEGFSGTVSEATILGLPTITTNCSGMEEILGQNNKYGIIVENSDKALYDGLKNILDNPEILLHYKKKVKERQSFFSTEETVKQVEDLFDSLLKKSKT